MSPHSRRRSVNIDEGIIAALAMVAKGSSLKKETPTGVASKIFTGDLPQLLSFSSENLSGTKRSVSMKEDIWLSLRARADEFDIRMTLAAENIITGNYPILTLDEIDDGRIRARKRELERATGAEVSNVNEICQPKPKSYSISPEIRREFKKARDETEAIAKLREQFRKDESPERKVINTDELTVKSDDDFNQAFNGKGKIERKLCSGGSFVGRDFINSSPEDGEEFYGGVKLL